MEKEDSLHIANLLRNIARYTLLILGVLVFLFALASGADAYGGGVRGVVKNSPNALPWLLLLAFLLLAWKRELVGGISIIVYGLALMVFITLMTHRFYLAVLIITLLIILLGVFFILSWYLRKKAT